MTVTFVERLWRDWRQGWGRYATKGPKSAPRPKLLYGRPAVLERPAWFARLAVEIARRKVRPYPLPHPVWTLPAVAVKDLSSFHGDLRRMARWAGYERLDVLLVQGDEIHQANVNELARLRPQLEQEGWLAIGGWHATSDDRAPELEAGVAIRVLHLVDCFCVNAESWYENDKKGQDRWRSRAYLSYLLQHGRKLPLAVWPLGSDSGSPAAVRDFDYVVWLEQGCMVYPQAYLNEYPGYTINASLLNLDQAKVPRDNQGVSVGVYNESGDRPLVVPWDRYEADLRALFLQGRTPPLLLYIGESVTTSGGWTRAGRLL